MPTRRISRIGRVVKETVSHVLMFELADPRLGFITVTEVDVAPDMKTATVKVSVLGDEKQAALCMKAIGQAHGRLQKALGDALTTKSVPHLEFRLDESVKKSVEIARLINMARSEYRHGDDEAEGSLAEPGDGGAAADERDDDLGDQDDADDVDEDDGDDQPDAEEKA